VSIFQRRYRENQWWAEPLPQIKAQMRGKAQGRTIEQLDDAYTLREPESAYSVHFDSKKVTLSDENSVHFNEND